MIIPEYWAQGRVQQRVRGRQVTMRRFGWSDMSQLDAQAMADARAHEAMAQVLAGVPQPGFERKVAYNGADGVPIREEVLQRAGPEVVTRNSYGAHCLNTPRALFADVDYEQPRYTSGWGKVYLVAIALAAGLAFAAVQRVAGTGFGVAAALVASLVALVVVSSLQGRAEARARAVAAPGIQQQALQRVQDFAAAHPDWSLRLYQTPAGMRVLATHRPFDPLEPEVQRFFDAIGVDRLYARMCRNQRCFRARLTGKPWRMDIAEHMRPRPGVWPINPERLPEREAWVARYEQRSAGYAACRFVQALGPERTDAAIAGVVALHDDLSKANRSLPLA
ncbi:MAG: hypothetical protein ACN6O3_12190 [Comamonas sp.]